MTVFENIKTLLSRNENKHEQAAPDGFCPNCWGRQEYSGSFYDAVKMEGIDTQNIELKKGWIQAYAEKNLSGIELKPNDAGLVCHSCQMAYTEHR